MLWLALEFPRLPLQALASPSSPSAVVERGRVRVADAQAAAAGVQPGLRLATALALAPGLQALAADSGREAAALLQLACWAGRFSPTVSLVPPQTVLLEIAGCLRLFGGQAALLQAALAELQAQGWTVAAGVAPTPLAARWLAAAAFAANPEAAAGPPPLRNTNTAELVSELAGLPLTLIARVSHWPAAASARLAACGCRQLGDLLALPTAELRLRIGEAPVTDLLRAQGSLPDPQTPFVFPEVFSQRLELPGRVEVAEGLLFGAQRLLAALAGWLQARQLLLRTAVLSLEHEHRSEACSRIPLQFGEPGCDPERWLRLLREHLARRPLPGSVLALRLEAEQVVAAGGETAALWGDKSGGEGASACIERLRARLGTAAVHSLTLTADYRPECATAPCEPLLPATAGREASEAASMARASASGPGLGPMTRPLCLFAPPQALAERHGVPHWRGPLRLQGRGERIESGWWDSGEGAGDVRRDYFVACNPAGQWLWIFRAADGWFLHGLFA
ncbi:DNA polymerase Y family protein [Dechloromonas sp. ZY10]|uniref:Y-family DNA polymerase n=1 Tax=Dechloromonas aquae TaxID=2664436 RepID=UPI003527B4A4